MESHQRNKHMSRLLLFVCAVLVAMGGIMGAVTRYVQGSYHQVTLNDSGHVAQIQTMDKTVKEILDKYEIVLKPWDEITPGLEEPIEEGMEIKITRAFKVTVAVDGGSKAIYLTHGNVGDVLRKANVVLNERDLINYPLGQEVAVGDYIRITRVDEEVLIETERIPYKIVTKENDKLDKGKEKLVQEGQEGEKERKILVAYHDGIEINRQIVEERVSKEPSDRIIHKGTYVASPQVIARGSAGRNRLKPGTYIFQATAYTPTGNPTKSGVMPKEGMIAVDPEVIPLRTEVKLEFPKPYEHLNGYYKAMDTGRLVKGGVIDVFMNTTRQEVMKFGRVYGVKVTIP